MLYDSYMSRELPTLMLFQHGKAITGQRMPEIGRKILLTEKNIINFFDLPTLAGPVTDKIEKIQEKKKNK